MKLRPARRAHVGAKPARRPRSAWPWMLVFRRQNHQTAATAVSGLDAPERLITELYTTAVEQLSSDKAPVRFGGLCALERIAQDDPSHRQTVVNVICAYLRMPFSPMAPAAKPELVASGGLNKPGAESAAEADGTGGAWQQERQVRLTAQRILAEHLRDDRTEDGQSADPPRSRFWDDIRLELTGATLIDFNLVNCVTADANFQRAAFSGDVSFTGAAFGGAARFGGAIFGGDASFGEVTFGGAARFAGVTFGGDASFGRAAFRGDASFPEAAFRGDALFGEATFRRAARFSGVAFDGVAEFGKATFGGEAGFRKAIFTGDAGFGEAVFGGDAWFDKTTFRGDASFNQATVINNAGFGEAAFGGDAWFDKTTFRRGAVFDKAAFSGGAWFGEAAFSGGAGFGEAVFGSDAWFDKATFRRGALFDEAAFGGDAGFGEAAFGGAVWFGAAAFSGGAGALHFERARILSPGASHMWPTGWRLADADGGGYAVVRANDDRGS